MLTNLFLASVLSALTGFGQPSFLDLNLPPVVIAEKTISLGYRYPVKSVSQVFKDNILLNIAYLDGRVKDSKDINWSQLENSSISEFVLEPNETFAYHDIVLPKYADKVKLTTNTSFGKSDGYKTDGYLYGDGVCHLASIISWAALDADLEVYAPSNHDFAAIPEIPKQFGVAIYYDPNQKSKSANENLYITNNQDKPVKFILEYKDNLLKVSVVKLV